MAKQVVTKDNLGSEFDQGSIESGKVRLKTDNTLTTSPSGEVGVNVGALGIPSVPGSYNDEAVTTTFSGTNYLNGKVNQEEVNEALDQQVKENADNIASVEGLPSGGTTGQYVTPDGSGGYQWTDIPSSGASNDEDLTVSGLPSPLSGATTQEQVNTTVANEIYSIKNKVFNSQSFTSLGITALPSTFEGMNLTDDTDSSDIKTYQWASNVDGSGNGGYIQTNVVGSSLPCPGAQEVGQILNLKYWPAGVAGVPSTPPDWTNPNLTQATSTELASLQDGDLLSPVVSFADRNYGWCLVELDAIAVPQRIRLWHSGPLSGGAIIAVSDNGTTWQNLTIQTNNSIGGKIDKIVNLSKCLEGKYLAIRLNVGSPGADYNMYEILID